MIFSILSWIITSFVNGLLFFLFFVFLLYWFYLKELPRSPAPARPQFEEFLLSNTLREMLKKDKEELSSDADSVIALNMMFQFLFQELKDTQSIRRYIIRKLSVEFKELLTTKGAGKFVERITAKDFSLGSGCPMIHAIKLLSYNMDSEDKTIQEVSVLVDLEYENGFSISIDADLIWGKSAYIHVKIASLKGRARIQFTRQPFTHWNFSFVEDPAIQFSTGWKFDEFGFAHPKLTELIETQLRRSIRRKHTLPNYKVRFKPFFEPLYDRGLYKAHIDELLLKNANKQQLEEEELDVAASDELLTRRHSTLQEDDTRSLGGGSGGFEASKIRASSSSNDLRSSSSGGEKSGLPKNKSKNKLASVDLATRLKIDKSANKLFRYRQLCEKIGTDLTTVGRLVVNLKMCDRFPEALYSLNAAAPAITSTAAAQQPSAANSTSQAGQPVNPSSSSSSINSTNIRDSQVLLTNNTDKGPLNRSQSNQALSSATSGATSGSLANQQQQQQQDSQCLVYITASVDTYSMKNLMAKQICKEHWPLIEFELVRTTPTQTLGINFMEVFFVNRAEITIQHITPNSLAAAVSNLKVFDIVYSLNQVRISSLKQLTKMVQKSGTTPLRFVVQRPCIVINNPVMTSTGVRTSTISTQSSCTAATIHEESSSMTASTACTAAAVVPDSTTSLIMPVTPGQQPSTSSEENSLAATAPVTPLPNSMLATPNSNSTAQQQPASTASTIMSSTRWRFERLEKKIKSSLGGLNQSSTNPNSPANITASYTPNASSSNAPNAAINLSASPSFASSQLSSQVSSQSDIVDSSCSTTSQLLSVNVPATSGGSTSVTPSAKHSPNTPTPVSTLVANSASLANPLPTITNTASASNLVEFFCNVAESKINDELRKLDLISLLTNSSSPNCESPNNTTNSNDSSPNEMSNYSTQRSISYFKRSKEIKLEKENLLYGFNNKPVILDDETLTFDLNGNTNYLNLFLWTVQFIGKGVRKKNLLLGYISLPLNEVTVDCWNTSKGEMQATYHFNPIEEFKATAAISRLTRSHVINDHPGYEPSLAMGTITVNIQHNLDPSQPSDQQPQSVTVKTTATTATNLSTSSSESSSSSSSSSPSQQNSKNSSSISRSIDEKSLANTIAQELVEQKEKEIELIKKNWNGGGFVDDVEDDGTTHKFVNITFTETVTCQSCNKKIWLKNAFQCAYCGLIIHIKCYDKTIEKSLCPRFDARKTADQQKSQGGHGGDDSFHEIHSTDLGDGMSQSSRATTATTATAAATSGIVSSLFNTLRQRRVNNPSDQQTISPNSTASASQEKDNVSLNSVSSSSTTSYFKNKYLGENLSFGKTVSAASKTVKSKFSKDRALETLRKYRGSPKKCDATADLAANIDTNSDDISLDADEFKDIDQNDEKLYGTELYNELPYEERKIKFEENINKYRCSIDEMTRMREELAKELEQVQSSKESSTSSASSSSSSKSGENSALRQQEAYLKSQVKHISDQIKCVGFLLMQAQLGLEAINDEMMFAQKKSFSPGSGQPPRPPPPPPRPPSPSPPPLPSTLPAGDPLESSESLSSQPITTASRDLESLNSEANLNDLAECDDENNASCEDEQQQKQQQLLNLCSQLPPELVVSNHDDNPTQSS